MSNPCQIDDCVNHGAVRWFSGLKWLLLLGLLLGTLFSFFFNANGDSSIVKTTTTPIATTVQTPSLFSVEGIEISKIRPGVGTGLVTADIGLKGKAIPGSTVALLSADGNVMVDNIPTTPQGEWNISFTTGELLPGDYELTARMTDPQGNVTNLANPFTITIGSASADGATTEPTAVPAITEPTAVPATTEPTVVAQATVSPTSTTSPITVTENIFETLQSRGNFKTFLSLAEASGVAPTINGSYKPLTLFAPTDEAFNALPAGVLDQLLNNPQELEDVLKQHLIDGGVSSADFATGKILRSSTATALLLNQSADGKGFIINGSPISQPDLPATNGTIHVIDRVLYPLTGAADGGIPPVYTNVIEALQKFGGFETLLQQLQATGLADELKNPDQTFTMFAPTDAAFQALSAEQLNLLSADPEAMRALLNYHISPASLDSYDIELQGNYRTLADQRLLTITKSEKGLLVNGVPLVVANVMTKNGIVHIIGQALTPPLNDVAAPVIDDSGVATFKGPLLTIVGSGTPGTTLQVTLNYVIFGTTIVGEDGRWLVKGDVANGDYEIIAYTLNDQKLPLVESKPVYLKVE